MADKPCRMCIRLGKTCAFCLRAARRVVRQTMLAEGEKLLTAKVEWKG